jgi:hypothetical protein
VDGGGEDSDALTGGEREGAGASGGLEAGVVLFDNGGELVVDEGAR